MEQRSYNPLEHFNSSEILSLKRNIDDAIDNLLMQNAFFGFSQLTRRAIDVSKKEKVFAKNDYLIDAIHLLATERVNATLTGNEAKTLINIEKDQKDINRGKFTTLEMYLAETNCIEYAKSKNPSLLINPEIVEKHLKTMLFISDEQREAVYHTCFSDNMASIYQGYAGAGKSMTAIVIKLSYKEAGFDIKGLGLSWNAASVLSASAKIDDCESIETFCIAYEKSKTTKSSPFEKDCLLIVDEAGLVGTRHLHTILKAAKDAKDNFGLNVKVILTGDSLQLLPVAAGGIFKTLEKEIGSATIKTIRRQNQKSQRKMVELSSQRRSGNALYIMQQQENIEWGKNHETTVNMLIRDYLSYRVAQSEKKALILALSNQHVLEINEKVRAACKKLGFLSGLEVQLTVSDGKNKAWRANFCRGDEIVVRANYRDLEVYEVPRDKNGNVVENYDISTYKPKTDDNGNPRRGVFNRNNGRVVRVQPSTEIEGSYDIIFDMEGDIAGRAVINTRKHLGDNGALPIHHNYATTIYGSQGQTVNEVFMLFDAGIEFRLFYVGISRHKENLTMYLNETLLHDLLDRAKNKSGARKNPNEKEQEIELGRYTRTEMLNMVSSLCGRKSEKPTNVDYINEISKPKEKEIPASALYDIVPVNYTDNYSDYDDGYKIVSKENIEDEKSINAFWQALYVEEKSNFEGREDVLAQIRIDALEMNEKFQKFKRTILKNSGMDEDYQLEERDRLYLKPKTSVRYPKIDLQAIREEEDSQYQETVVIPESTINQKRFNRGIEAFQPKANVYSREEDERIQKEEIRALSNLSLQEMLNQIEGVETEEERIKREQRELNEGQITRVSSKVFSSVTGLDFSKKPKKNEEKEEDLILEVLTKKEVPYIKEETPFLTINKKGDIEIKDDLIIGRTEEDRENFIEWLNKNKNNEENREGFWEEGKYHEPRFITNDINGVVKERYDQFGNAKIGTGYPPLLSNPFSSEETPVLLVPGVLEWLISYQYYTKKGYENIAESIQEKYDSLEDFVENADDEERKALSKIPEIVWDAKSIDYGLLKEYIKGRELKIVRGRDPKNERWALNVRKKLWEEWYIKSEVSPPFPSNDGDYEEPWANATEEELKIAEGRFNRGKMDLVRAIASIKK